MALAPALTRLVPALSLTASVIDPERPAASSSLVFTYQLEQARYRQYLARYFSQDPMRSAGLGLGTPVRLSALAEGRRRPVFLERFLPSLGVGDVLGVSFRMPDSRVFLCALQRERHSTFSPADEQQLGQVGGLLAQATVGFSLKRSGRRGTLGLVLFDAGCEIVQCDASAHGLLGASGVGRLESLARQALQRSGESLHALGQGLQVAFVPQAHDSPVRLLAELLTRVSRPELDPGHVRRYRFSPAEVRVLEHLVGDQLSDEALAERTQLTARTVKHHLANARRKVGARTRRDLRSLLLCDAAGGERFQ